jgi:site-specific recombinase XerD
MIAATFQSLLQGFFTDRLLRQRQASPHTIAGYRDTFRLLFRFSADQLGKAPSTLSTEDFQPAFIGRFLEHLEQQRSNSSRTRNARLAAIHSFFRYVAVAEPAHALLCQQVLAMPSKRHQRRPIAFLDAAEIAAILAAPDLSTWIGRRDRALLAVGFQTGLRVSELIGLRREHVVMGTGAHVRCDGKGRNNGARRSDETRPPSFAGQIVFQPAVEPSACFRAFAVARSVAMRSKNWWLGMRSGRNKRVHH